MTTLAEPVRTSNGSDAPGPWIGLLNGFDLRIDGDPVTLPLNAQRLLAFLALHRRLLLRAHVAGSLWTDTPDCKANASLRSAVWRIERLGHRLLDATRTHLGLSPIIGVDVTEAADVARFLTGTVDDLADLPPNLHLTFSAGDLLPDWYDEADWLLMERTRFHQLRLHALERLCELLVAHGRIVEAVDAGLAAVTADPLRESAHRALISAYLAEGNTVEAIRQYDSFRRVLADEMGTVPTQHMENLMAGAW
jgi:DNA-binding SARP family transcriptional activator